MKAPLHILHLEDDPNDFTLIQSALAREGIEFKTTRAQNREQFVEALEQGSIDLILSDFALPTFDGLSAIEIARDRWPDVPVILVSGTLGEEMAIDSFKKGATDYVLKERLTRLGPAVRRAMQEVQERNERRHLETQFIEAQKMEVMGRLAAGVAHDFNNILAVITFSTDFLNLGLPLEDPLQEHVEAIRHASQRAAGLTRQLLVFSRRQQVQPVVLDLDAVIEDCDRMLRRLIGENIDLTIVPGRQPGRIKADAGYVGQVLLNLVINARDAMPNGGKLTISTHLVSLDESYVRDHTDATAGDYVMLSVSDTGTGISQEVQARLFEPFFTTKPKGKGTGLGLATCRTIVDQSGGHIGVYSELGKGTTFKVYFPQVELPLEEVTGSTLTEPLPRGTETLLVVEDEPIIRRLARNALLAQGYTVLGAANGRDALRVAQEHNGAPIRLVVTDVIMPVMNGNEMADWLKATYPDLKFLFMSGYTDDAITQHGVLDTGAEFLSKPYSPAALARKVRAILDAQS